MGMVFLPVLFVIIIQFIHTLFIILKFKSSFPLYFKIKQIIILHITLSIIFTYIGFKFGLKIAQLNDFFGSDVFGDRSGLLFLFGILLPGISCYIANSIPFSIHRRNMS